MIARYTSRMDLRETYNTIAEDWARDHGSDKWGKDERDTFISLLPKNALVLDIGCGPGMKSKYFADNGLRVIGVDLSEKMIEIAKREYPNLDFRVGDITHLDIIPEMFDGIHAQAVLLHIPKVDVPHVIAGLKDKLNDGGYLYIAVKEKWPEGKEEEILKENDYGYEYERFFSYFTLPEIKQYLADAGLTLCHENIAPTGNTNWIQVIARKV